MTVVAAYLYRHGKRVREVAIDEKIECPQDKSEFVWIGIAIIVASGLFIIWRERLQARSLKSA